MQTLETTLGSRAVLELDINTSVLVEPDLLGVGRREVVPAGNIYIVSIETRTP